MCEGKHVEADGRTAPAEMSASATAPARGEIVRRRPFEGEWMPEDYFRRATWDEVFPRYDGAPVEVDLGSGDGTFLANMAAGMPGHRFLGVERLLGRVRACCRKVREAGALDRARVLRLESLYTVRWLLPLASVQRLHLLFPDPWPKKKHHERRIFSASFLDDVARVLRPGGEFLFKTDDADYAEWALERVPTEGPWTRLPWQEGDFFYPTTDFEAHWLAQGRKIHRLRLRFEGGAG